MRKTNSLERIQKLTEMCLLEERILSPKTLHFGRQIIYWECHEQLWSEAIPDYHYESRFLSFKRALRPGSNLYHVAVWEHLISEFSKAALTVPTDRLVAIAGLAKEMDATVNGALGDYYAGVWEFEFLDQLCWFCMIGPTFWSLGRRDQYIAPSWSWASVNNPVKQAMRYYSPQYFSDVISITTELKRESEPFGLVSSGTLTIRGCLHEVNFIDNISLRRVNDSEEMEITQGSKSEKSVHNLIAQSLLWDYDPSDIVGLTRHIENVRSLPFYVLMIREAHMWQKNKEHEPEGEIRGMFCLLLQLTGNARGQYQRVGGVLFDDESTEVLKETTGLQDLPKKCYLEANELGRYTIEII